MKIDLRQGDCFEMKNEMTEDYIRRQAVLDIIKSEFLSNARASNSDTETAISNIKTKISQLMPVTLEEPKTGRWEQYGYSWEDKFKCSECGEEQPKILCGERIIGHWSDYCPNCGAKMESEDKE